MTDSDSLFKVREKAKDSANATTPTTRGSVTPRGQASFLVSPVRNHSPAAFAAIVQSLEAKGWRVHWPARDTNQDDPTGLNICRENLRAIRQSDVIHVVWDGISQGCLFDLGMAFALGKRIAVLSLPAPTREKSFQNMVRAWEVAA